MGSIRNPRLRKGKRGERRGERYVHRDGFSKGKVCIKMACRGGSMYNDEFFKGSVLGLWVKISRWRNWDECWDLED